MSDKTPSLPPDDWLRPSGPEPARQPPSTTEENDIAQPAAAAVGPSPATDERAPLGTAPSVAEHASVVTLPEVFQQAAALAPLDRLRLAARLWTMLRPVHRAALVHFQWERFDAPAVSSEAPHSTIDRAAAVPPTSLPLATAIASDRLWHVLFDRSHTSGLYSAPRRFDLATIFVVTGAYSVLLGVMSILNFVPAAKIIIGLLLAFVAVAQSMYHEKANPRGVSVVAGSIGYAAISFVFWLIAPRSFPNSFMFVVVINGLIGGALFGYVAGVLVGGMFLVADMLRTRSGTRREIHASESGTDIDDDSAKPPVPTTRAQATMWNEC